MTLFIDSDILLDAILLRVPYDDFAVKVLSLADKKEYMLVASAHSLLNVYYFTRKIANKEAASKSLFLLQTKHHIADTTKSAVTSALRSDFADMEDAVQHAVALENNCQIIITRNIKDYKKSTIPVMTSEQYLKTPKH